MAIPIALILAAVQLAKGIADKSKANKEAADLQKNRPKYKVSKSAFDDLSLTESELAGGLSARAENAYQAETNKQLSASLDAILRGGGSVNNVADVFGASEEGRGRLAMLQDQIRFGQIKNVMEARRRMIEEEDKKFLYNIDAPFKDRAQAVGIARKSANDQIWSGLTNAGTAAINMQNRSDSNNDFKGDGKKSTFLHQGNMPQYMFEGRTHNWQPTNPTNSSISSSTDGSHRNAAPIVEDYSNFELPNYLDDPLWRTGGHNVYQ